MQLRGGGSALPGLVVEKLDPGFLARVLSSLPRGVVVITGTNGKTTTAKIVTELLRSAGLRVFTNQTGSNFTRGIVSEILGEIKKSKLDADIAVLELDEAYAVRFVKQIKPQFVLLLNVQPDQEDRFGGVEKTAKLLEKVALSACNGIVLNRDDPLVTKIGDVIARNEETKQSRLNELRITTQDVRGKTQPGSLPPNQATAPHLRAGAWVRNDNGGVVVKYFGYSAKLAGKFGEQSSPKSKPADVELTSFMNGAAEYKIDGKRYMTALQLSGSHNALNSAAALAMVRMVIGDKVKIYKLLKTLAEIKPAFGRGEIIKVNGQEIEIILAKNPTGWRLSLLSQYNRNAETMIAINNNYGDGVDTKWISEVDFSCLQKVAVVSGMCADIVARRLKDSGAKNDEVEPDIKKALRIFLSSRGSKKQIFCNYTAMMEIRKLLM